MKANLIKLSIAAGVYLFVAAGCGSSQKPDGDHHDKDHHDKDHDGEHKGEHHRAMTPEVKSFHEVLKPVYHADKGPGRVEQTCSASASLSEKAGPVANEALTQSVADLATACGAEGRAEVEAKLEIVHDAFHAVMDKK